MMRRPRVLLRSVPSASSLRLTFERIRGASRGMISKIGPEHQRWWLVCDADLSGAAVAFFGSVRQM